MHLVTLVDAAVSRSRTTLSALVLVLATGYAGPTSRSEKEADPDISIPINYVNLNHEGIGPEDVERHPVARVRDPRRPSCPG